MENYNTNIKSLITYSKGGVISKVVYKNDHDNVTLFCMSRGTDISEHTSTKSGTIYVIEGDGVFRLEGKDIKMMEGVVILMKKNAKHSLKTIKDTSFLLMLHD